MVLVFDFSPEGFTRLSDLERMATTRLEELGIPAPERTGLVPGRPGVIKIQLDTKAPVMVQSKIEASSLRDFLTTENPD